MAVPGWEGGKVVTGHKPLRGGHVYDLKGGDHAGAHMPKLGQLQFFNLQFNVIYTSIRLGKPREKPKCIQFSLAGQLREVSLIGTVLPDREA